VAHSLLYLLPHAHAGYAPGPATRSREGTGLLASSSLQWWRTKRRPRASNPKKSGQPSVVSSGHPLLAWSVRCETDVLKAPNAQIAKGLPLPYSVQNRSTNWLRYSWHASASLIACIVLAPSQCELLSHRYRRSFGLRLSPVQKGQSVQNCSRRGEPQSCVFIRAEPLWIRGLNLCSFCRRLVRFVEIIGIAIRAPYDRRPSSMTAPVFSFTRSLSPDGRWRSKMASTAAINFQRGSVHLPAASIHRHGNMRLRQFLVPVTIPSSAPR
jgi:hypothetical protein